MTTDASPNAVPNNFEAQNAKMQQQRAQAMDSQFRRTALDKFSSGPSFKSGSKPGEPLGPGSGYPQKFISDYNAFQNAYQAQHKDHPIYWDNAQEWWNDVRRHLDQSMEESGEKLKGDAVDRLRGPKSEFEREAPK